MPTYLYLCETCNLEFEETHSISEEVQECSKCHNKPKRLISSGNFILKGGGWYKEGYSK